MGIRLSAEDFWSFSLALYCRPPVAQACLALQDRRRADVNILLAICWLAARGYETSVEGINAAMGAVAPWNDAVVAPLRSARRQVGDNFADLGRAERQSIRHGLLSVELECEKVAQGRIAAALEQHVDALSAVPARDLAATGLDRYLAGIVGVPDSEDRADLAAILEQL